MKNSKQKTFRHGSAVFTDKHCLYRIAVVRYVDSLFYESGDACRCHSRCYSLIVRELFGIGKNTFRHYLHYPSDRLTGVVIPRKLRELLRLYVILVKRLPEGTVSGYFASAWEDVAIADRRCKKAAVSSVLR